MNTCIRKFALSNGLVLFVHDATRRYYEDYHLVRLEVAGEIPLSEEFFDDKESFVEAMRLLGEAVIYRRLLERMGVPYQEIDRAREYLIRSFESHSLRYLSNDGFPGKFVRSQFAAACKKAVLK